MTLIDEMIRRRKALIQKIAKINEIFDGSPDGYLICRNRKNNFRYSRTIKQTVGGKVFEKEVYLKKNDPLLLDLAKRDYYKQYIQDLQQELKSIEAYLKYCSETSHVAQYLEKHPGIREIIQPALIDRTEQLLKWATEPYERNALHPETLIYITDGGFYVRSKAEQMIANMYLEAGIPFRYEEPVLTPSGYILHPDFHLFSLRDHSEWYHEHNGMMLDDSYYLRYTKKLQMFRSVNIIPGVNLLQTFESSGHPLNPESIRHLIRTYLQ